MKKFIIIAIVLIIVIGAIVWYMKRKKAQEEALAGLPPSKPATGGGGQIIGADIPKPVVSAGNPYKVLRTFSQGTDTIFQLDKTEFSKGNFKVGDTITIASGQYKGQHKLSYVGSSYSTIYVKAGFAGDWVGTLYKA